MSEEIHLSAEELQALKETFRVQTEEMLDIYAQKLLAIERGEDVEEGLKAIQRVVHTIKGDAMALELDQLAELAHRVEDFLGRLRTEMKSPQRRDIDLLLSCGDRLAELLRRSAGENDAAPPFELQRLFEELEQALARPEGPIAPAVRRYRLTLWFDEGCQMRSAGAFVVTRRLGEIATLVDCVPDPESGELESARTWKVTVDSDAEPGALERAARVAGVIRRVSMRGASRRAVPDGRSPKRIPKGTKKTGAPVGEGSSVVPVESPSEPSPSGRTRGSTGGGEQLRVDVDKVDRIINLVGELVIGRSMLTQGLLETAERHDGSLERLDAANDFLERTLSELQTAALKMRMVPLERVFRRFPRLVRELAHGCGKRVELELEGGTTELDKRIVDALGEPLLHLVRNALDHGLESPEERQRLGKPPSARVKLSAFYQGNHVHVVVEDDGRGIDVTEVAERAVEMGVVKPAELEVMSPGEVLNLIYRPGFSTRAQVSRISGRGIGMDVVREVIEGLKGTIELDTAPGKSTRFLLRLPLTLAIQRAILVDVAQKTFAVPLTSVLEIVRVFPHEVEGVLKRPVLHRRGQVIPLVDVGTALGLAEGNERLPERAFVLLVGEAERRVGLVVEELVGEHELVVKPIEDSFPRNPGISGASILGNGQVVLILDIRALMNPSATHRTEATVPSFARGSRATMGSESRGVSS